MANEHPAAVNTIEEALSCLNVTSSTLSSDEKRDLDERGYLVLPEIIDAAWLKQLRAAFEQVGKQQGQTTGSQKSGTRQLKNLVNEGEVFKRIYTHPKLLAVAHRILEGPFSLFLLTGRDPLPGYGQQGLHADWVPRVAQKPYHIVTAICLLDDFTPENGATRLVPGTHRLPGQPPKAMADPAGRHPQQIIITARAGSVLIINGHLWHSGTRNNSKDFRRVLQCQFVRREGLRPDHLQYNSIEKFEPAVRFILGV